MVEISDDDMRKALGGARDYVLVLLRPGPRYTAREVRPPEDARLIWEHGRRNFELRAAGKMLLVGPASGPDIVGLSVFGIGVAEVRELMDQDPAIRAGLLVYETMDWMSFPGDGLPAA
jgi:hypothetical protein